MRTGTGVAQTVSRHLSMMPQSDLEQEIELVRHDLSAGDSEHSKHDDGTSPLLAGNVLVRALITRSVD